METVYATVNTEHLKGIALDYAVACAAKVWLVANERWPTMTLDPCFIGVSTDVDEVVRLIPRNSFRQDYAPFQPQLDPWWCVHFLERFNMWISPPLRNQGPDLEGWDVQYYASSEDMDVKGQAFNVGSLSTAVCLAIVDGELGAVVHVPLDMVRASGISVYEVVRL